MLEGRAAFSPPFMKLLISSSSLSVALLWAAAFSVNAQQVNVTQEHNNPSRDGLYIDAAFTLGNAPNLARDMGFDGTISGHVYAQPLYIEGGPNGAMVIAVTESNNVYALHADTGAVIWSRTDIGTPAPEGSPCPGNIIPVGITGTPVVDLASRSLFFDALVSGNPNKHFIYSLNVDTGATHANWPVNVDNSVPGFTSGIQEERGALALVNGIVYVAYSGWVGDCGPYHGWVVGVDINNPSNVMGWKTDAEGGGIWGHGGVASDGTNMFVVTGNTFTTPGDPWSGGEAIVRFTAGPVFDDFWAPVNWQALDASDTDLGGCSATAHRCARRKPVTACARFGQRSQCLFARSKQPGRCRSGGSYDERIQCHASRYVVCCLPDCRRNTFCFSYRGERRTSVLYNQRDKSANHCSRLERQSGRARVPLGDDD